MAEAPHGGGRLRLHHVVEGRAGAPWLVFSNSLATDLTLWDDQVTALSADWRILRYDLRGHGCSPRSPMTRHDLDVLARDLLSVMDEAGVRRGIHVGVSIGALAGIAAARTAPDRFKALVCCNARCRSSTQSAADLAARAERAGSQGMQALVAPTLDKWFGGARLPLSEEARSRIGGMIAATSATDFAAYARGMQDYDLDDAVGRLPLRVLLLAGGDDGAIPAHFEALSKRHPALGYAAIEGAGHLPNIHAPGAFNAALVGLLARARRESGGPAKT